MSISKSTHTHSHILKHITPTFKYMTPTHIKSLTHHSYKHSMGGGFTLPLLLCAYSKANSPALGFKELGQPPAPRMGRGGRKPGVEGKQEEEEAAVEAWHHLSWNVTIISSLSFSCLQRWHHPIGAPPPSVLSIAVWGGRECVHLRACPRSIVEREKEREENMRGCLSALLLSRFIPTKKVKTLIADNLMSLFLVCCW